ncbi:alpha/beta fold hydrolase [Xylophilus sp.]|uniref:alpha/beta fold hydrolase n=1 Tax=Xylophilus sp. TaxID=2653893 RepID=UPI0013B7CE51|nr:alpha/beta hydrolase [Xylophilus sp.]KAF1046936.1 MAG: Lipase 1 [Xylophilus sp.]
MEIDVLGQRSFVYTGGRPSVAGQPTAVFLHGVLGDHSVWGLQTRWFAHHGWNVLAPDLPGHAKSAGAPPASVEDAARFAVALLDAAGVERAALVGHSLGSLIALQAAADAPRRVTHLALVATAWPMPVAPALLESALRTPQRAIDLVAALSHSTLAPPAGAVAAGLWLPGSTRALMRRVLAGRREANAFHAGFTACDGYQGGAAAAAAVTCPTLAVLGRRDQMTPPHAGRALAARIAGAQVVELEAGHALMAEAPDAVLGALRGFLAA